MTTAANAPTKVERYRPSEEVQQHILNVINLRALHTLDYFYGPSPAVDHIVAMFPGKTRRDLIYSSNYTLDHGHLWMEWITGIRKDLGDPVGDSSPLRGVTLDNRSNRDIADAIYSGKSPIDLYDEGLAWLAIDDETQDIFWQAVHSTLSGDMRYPLFYRMRAQNARLFMRDKDIMVSYWPTMMDMIRNRPRTTTRLGRWITRYCPGIDQPSLQAIIALCDLTPPKLNITTDPDEIERVYTNGPSSCMAYTAAKYGSSQHPVRVYGDSPNLALAWIERGSKITARCLVMQDKSGIATIYGDRSRMLGALRAEGYDVDGEVHGALIRYIEDDNKGVPILPYIDNGAVKAVRADGKRWFKIVDDGGSYDYYGDRTDGLSEEVEMNYCEFMDEYTHDDLETVIVGYRRSSAIYASWSTRACESNATYSGHYGYYVVDDYAVTTSTGVVFHENDPHLANDYTYCVDREEWVPHDEIENDDEDNLEPTAEAA